MWILETVFLILALMSSLPVIIIHIGQWCGKNCMIDAEQVMATFVFWVATAVVHYLRQ